ncbi:MAG: hypothetical protein RL518_627 [Pseudomonadota bacterium]|jgi:hypothetical protein
MGMFSTEQFEQVCDRAKAFVSSSHFILWSIPCIMLARLLASSPADPDLFARVAMGRLALSLTYVPLQDPFAFTPTLSTWIDHEWLSGVVFYLVTTAAGDAGLVLLKALLSTSSALLVILASKRYAPDFPSRFLWITLCLLHASAAWTSTLRCQAFTYLFIPMLYWAINDYRKHQRLFALALSPVMAVAWVNMHGGYALGCVLVALLIGVEVVQKRLSGALVAIALGWLLAPIFTPYGWTRFVSFLIGSLGMERPGILEWAPLFDDISAGLLTLLLCIPLFTGMLLSRGKGDLFGIAALLFSTYCAFRHIRFLPFFMITAAIFGAPYVQALCERLRTLRPHLFTATVRCGALVSVALVGAVAVQLLVTVVSPSAYRMNYKNFPIGAVEWMRSQETRGKLLVDFNTGSYALWRLYPNMKISVDGRYEECYPESTVRDNALALRPDLEVGRAALERFDPTHILVPLNLNLKNPETAFGEGWSVVYRDPQAIILSHVRAQEGISTMDTALVPKDMWRPEF